MPTKIPPCKAGSIDSVKINPSLLMMRECVVPHSTVTVAYGITWPCIDLIEVILSDLGRVKILKSGMLLLYGHMATVVLKSFCSS